MSTKWQIGDRIHGRWEVYEIFKGGMGVVYVVYDHETGELFAAKTFLDEIFELSPAIAGRFRKEAITWINLDRHPNVTRAFAVHDIEGKPFLFLEYAGNGDLSKLLATGICAMPESRPQTLRMAIQFCDGMVHLRSKGIEVHRDIKPQNCLLTPFDLMVTDFGLAKVFDEPESSDGLPHRQVRESSGTRTGKAMGTHTHMAPEQFDDAAHVDVRADIYSFGVMLCQMFTGQLPFNGKSWEESKYLHKNARPQTSAISHPLLITLVNTCLNKQPTDRFTDFAEVRKELAGIYESETGKLAPKPAIGGELDAHDWTNKGVSLNKLGRPKEAIVCFDHSLAINDRLEATWVNKGAAFGELGLYEKELECCERAIKLNPQFDLAWTNKGVALWSLQRNQEALASMEQALKINPLSAEAWSNKGTVLSTMGRIDEALDCYDHALELNPYLDHAWHCKAAVLRELNQHEEAIACCDRAIEINPRLEKAWVNKIASLGVLSRLEEADVCCDRLLKINPRSEKGWTYKGNVFEARWQMQEALDCYDRAIEINPSYGEAWHNKGVALGNMDRFSEALKCFEKALELGHLAAAPAIAMCRQFLAKQA